MTTNKRKIVIVGGYPPSNVGLAEYVHAITKELSRNKEIEVKVLADIVVGQPKFSKLSDNCIIDRCWKYNNVLSFIRLYLRIRKERPDTVWFNIIFTSFADRRIPVFLSLMLPFLCHVSGIFTAVMMHHLLECMDTNDIKHKRVGTLEKLAITTITKLLTKVDHVFVPIKKYKDILERKYGSKNVYVIPHGFLDAGMTPPRKSLSKDILIFGKFGSYKQVEPAVAILDHIKQSYTDARLIVAGGSHPSYPDYIKRMRKQYAHRDDIIFTGYVPEGELESVFTNAALMLQPYTSMTGVSGVTHLACSYGLPIVTCDLSDFREMQDEIGIEFFFFQKGDMKAGAELINALFGSPDRIDRAAQNNYLLSRKVAMDEISQRYSRFFSKAISFGRTSTV